MSSTVRIFSATFVMISSEISDRLDKFMLAREETKSDIVERALMPFFRKR